MKHIIIPTLAMAVAFVSACKKKTTDTPKTDTCDKVWTVLSSAKTYSATVTGGYLQMSVTNCKTTEQLSVYRQSLTGDFTAVINFTNFTPGTGLGGFAQMVISDPLKLDSGFVLCGIGSGLISAQVGKKSANVASCPNGYGKMTITRSGTSLTATIESDAYTATQTGQWLSTTSNIGIQLGSNINDLSGSLGIRVMDVTVTTTSTTWMAEKFDCNSLK